MGRGLSGPWKLHKSPGFLLELSKAEMTSLAGKFYYAIMAVPSPPSLSCFQLHCKYLGKDDPVCSKTQKQLSLGWVGIRAWGPNTSAANGLTASISSYASCAKPARFYSKLLFSSLGNHSCVDAGLWLREGWSEREKIETRFSLHSSGDRFGTWANALTSPARVEQKQCCLQLPWGIFLSTNWPLPTPFQQEISFLFFLFNRCEGVDNLCKPICHFV